MDTTVHSIGLQDDLDKGWSLLQDAETGQRGYLLTGRDQYLTPWKNAVAGIPSQYQSIAGQLSGYPECKQDFNDWQALSAKKLEELQAGIEKRRKEGFDAAVQLVNTDSGLETMDKIRVLVGRIKSSLKAGCAELDTLRHQQMENAIRWTGAAGVSGIVAGGVALTLFLMSRRQAETDTLMQRRAESAEEAGQRKESFFASMSHEIRTPMNAVLGFTDLLETEPLTEKQHGYIFSIKEAGRSLLQLINDILDLSKAEAGMIELHRGPVDVRDTCEFVRTVVGQSCVQKGLDLRLDFGRSLPGALILDESRLRQILVNLAGNAVRFTSKGFVRIAAAVEYSADSDAHVRLILTVQDTGTGIPQNRQVAIFTPFTQSDSRRSEEKQGTGLGLSIVKRLTELMGGTVSVESEPGRGSTFTVVIPQVEIAVQPRPAESEVAGKRINLDDFQPLEILVVDDNSANRDLLEGIFSKTHHQTRFAANGQEALDSIRQRKPGLVLMDVRMPIMNGIEAVTAMRRQPDLESIPVIAVTASSFLREEGSVRHHFSGYLRKPFTRVELYHEISLFFPVLPAPDSEPVVLFAHETPESAEHHAAWQSAIRRMRQMEASTWRALRETLAITEARDFADRLTILANATGCPPLRSYAEVLHRHAANYAADELESHLAAFPQLITQLEKIVITA
jgi:signal transduction histidine kinase/DNA-binding NarL/FixJ family response regulator